MASAPLEDGSNLQSKFIICLKSANLNGTEAIPVLPGVQLSSSISLISLVYLSLYLSTSVNYTREHTSKHFERKITFF